MDADLRPSERLGRHWPRMKALRPPSLPRARLTSAFGSRDGFFVLCPLFLFNVWQRCLCRRPALEQGSSAGRAGGTRVTAERGPQACPAPPPGWTDFCRRQISWGAAEAGLAGLLLFCVSSGLRAQGLVPHGAGGQRGGAQMPERSGFPLWVGTSLLFQQTRLAEGGAQPWRRAPDWAAGLCQSHETDVLFAMKRNRRALFSSIVLFCLSWFRAARK